MDPVLSDPTYRIDVLLHDVDTLTVLGGAVSENFANLRAGWKAATTDPSVEELEAKILEAIGTGDAEAVELAMMNAQLAKGDRSQIRGRIARAVLPALRQAYGEIAADNFAMIAAAFDDAADRLTSCAAGVDITLDAEKIVGLSAKERSAWMDAAVAAKELDRRFAALMGAATLAGIPTEATGSVIALACDPGSAHRRRTYEAWASSGRCGRWSALLALGVTLRAATLDGFAPYADPAPIVVRQVTVAMGAGVHGTRQVPVDPEDAAFTERKRAAATT